jgi:hypothetical protein
VVPLHEDLTLDLMVPLHEDLTLDLKITTDNNHRQLLQYENDGAKS